MYKKLNNKEWEEAVNLYYKENNDITIKEYCTINNLNKNQFYYHKRRISNNEYKGLVFQAIQLIDIFISDNELEDTFSLIISFLSFN